MAAITDLSDLINRATGGSSGTPESVFFAKMPRIAGSAATATVGGRMASLWRYDGINWPAGALPGAVEAPTRSTQGALVGWTNPGGSREKHLIQMFGSSISGGTILLYDRLLQYGGVGNVATAQTVGGTITRNTGGVGNFAFLEINSQIGASSTTVSMSYVDQAGNTAETSPATVIGNTNFREATRAIMLPLNSPDYGIRSVVSFTLAATTGTAGDLDLVVGKPIAYLNVTAAGVAGVRDFTTGMPGIPKIDTDACLAALWMPAGTTAPDIFGGLSTVEA